VEHSGSLPAILVGDFNMRNYSYAFQYLENYGTKPLQDVYRIFHGGIAPMDYTFSHFDINYNPLGDGKNRRIDYIFASSGISVLNCSIPKDSYGINQTYSDHYPVFCEIEF
jgi:endonuclease/exonuclease/phosphatase family metal-dependent hydrolase